MMRNQRPRFGDGEGRARPHCIQVEASYPIGDAEGSSPCSGSTSLHSSRTSVSHGLISCTVQVVQQSTGNSFFSGDESLVHEEETKLKTTMPSRWTLASQHGTWLVLPLAVLAGALVGAYFLMTNGSVAAAMGLLGAVDIMVVALCIAFIVSDNFRVLQLFGDGMDVLLQCNADQIHSVLSHDPRVRYIQALVFNRRRASCADDSASNSAAQDRLHFVRLELKGFAEAVEGFVVLDSAGTILWCNASLRRFFGYTEAELVSENIRILIPPPYNVAHDSLMRKYDRDSSVKKIVGCVRQVPVIDKSGKHSCVDLSVKERIDPSDGTNNLFIGALRFPQGPKLEVVLQEDVLRGTNVVDACNNLKTCREHFLVMDAKGILLFANAGITGMLGWTQQELLGSNVSMLMNPEVAAVHDSYLARYIAKVKEQTSGEWPPSNIVGRGRDLYARCRRGGYVRIWLTVHRIDAPSRLPEDCWFMATLVYIQGKESAKANFTVSPSSRRASNNGTSPRGRRRPSFIFSKVGSSIPSTMHLSQNLTTFTKKKCTVVLFDLHDLYVGEESLHEYCSFLTLLATACSKNNAQLHNPIGDRVMVTLNLTTANVSQRSCAGILMQYVLDTFRANCRQPTMCLCAAGAIAEAACATLGRHPVMVNESLELVSCMLNVAADAKLRNGLIEPFLYDELQYAYDCRLINTVTLHKQKGAQAIPLYELFSAKELDENEWMYQIKPKDKEDLLTPWRECWEHLSGRPARILPGQLEFADVQPAYDAALRSLARHCAAFPDDLTALWLKRAVLQRQAGWDRPVVERAGKLRYTAFLQVAES